MTRLILRGQIEDRRPTAFHKTKWRCNFLASSTVNESSQQISAEIVFLYTFSNAVYGGCRFCLSTKICKCAFLHAHFCTHTCSKKIQTSGIEPPTFGSSTHLHTAEPFGLVLGFRTLVQLFKKARLVDSNLIPAKSLPLCEPLCHHVTRPGGVFEP